MSSTGFSALSAMAGRLGRCLCTYTRLISYRGVPAASAHQRYSPAQQLSLRAQRSVRQGSRRADQSLVFSQQLHTSRWLSNDVNEPMKAEDHLYAKSHEWAFLEGNIATVGISNYAQEKLGDIVFVELPEEGAEFNQGDQFGVLESVKAAADVYCPVSGKVVEVNSALEDEPDLVNRDPYGEGWIVKLEVTEDSGANRLMSLEAYKEHVVESAV